MTNDKNNSSKNTWSLSEAKTELTEKDLSLVAGGGPSQAASASIFKGCCSGKHYDAATLG
jgi:hypothetical protein